MGNQHVHCDRDPIECSVEAMYAEMAEACRQRNRYHDAIERVLLDPATSDELKAALERALRPVESVES